MRVMLTATAAPIYQLRAATSASLPYPCLISTASQCCISSRNRTADSLRLCSRQARPVCCLPLPGLFCRHFDPEKCLKMSIAYQQSVSHDGDFISYSKTEGHSCRAQMEGRVWWSREDGLAEWLRNNSVVLRESSWRSKHFAVTQSMQSDTDTHSTDWDRRT
jgi:hypothetical protein